jgi:U3 small nucleolar RNA-associated protein 12
MVKIYQKYASSPALGVVASGLGNSLLSPSGNWAIVPALEDVHVWDVKTGALVQSCRVSEISSTKTPPTVTCLCAHTAATVSTKELIYSVGYSDGSIRLWDLGSPDHQPILIQTLQGHSKAVTALSYSHQDRLLVSGSKDTDVIVWDLVAESGLFRLKKCHRDEISALVWISSESTATNSKPTHLVSASKDSLIKVWDLKTQHCVETVLTHRGAVHSLDWIASESLLLSGSEDGQVRAWSVDLKTLSTKLDIEEETKDAQNEDATIKRALTLQGTLERASKEKVLHIKSLSKGDASFLAVQVCFSHVFL